MNCLSNIIGRQIINIKIAQSVGTVYNVRMDKKLSRIKSLEILVEEETGDLTYVLPVKYFRYTPYEVMIIATSKENMRGIEEYLPESVSSPIGKKCFDTRGQYVGRIKDIVYSDRLATTAIVIDELVYTSKDVSYASDELVIVKGKTNIKQNLEISTNAVAARNEEYTTTQNALFGMPNEAYYNIATSDNFEYDDVDMDDEEGINEEIVENREDEIVEEMVKNMVDEEIYTPIYIPKIEGIKTLVVAKNDQVEEDVETERPANVTKVVGGKDTLVGRKLCANVYGYNQALLASKGDVISAEIVEFCAKKGKLIELIKASDIH